MKINKYYKVLTIVMLLLIISPAALPVSNTIRAEAATISISNKTLTLEVGKSSLLKITGTNQKATWSTSNKAIAKVSSSGKVTAIKAGKATITAAVNKNKYTCKLTVINPVNPYIDNAPFGAQEITTDDFQYVIPNDWFYKYDGNLYSCPKESVDSEDASSVEFYFFEMDFDTFDYSIMKSILEEDFTKEKVTSDFSKDLISAGIITDETQISYTDFKTSDYETALGTAFKIEFNILLDGNIRREAIYYLYTKDYCFVLYTDDIEDSITPDALTVGEYILQSIHIK